MNIYMYMYIYIYIMYKPCKQEMLARHGGRPGEAGRILLVKRYLGGIDLFYQV